MFNCPHCGKESISIGRKMWLGPLTPATCKQCGKRIGVSWWASQLVYTPFFITLTFVPHIIKSNLLDILVIAGVFIITNIVYVKYVPLEAK